MGAVLPGFAWNVCKGHCRVCNVYMVFLWDERHPPVSTSNRVQLEVLDQPQGWVQLEVIGEPHFH